VATVTDQQAVVATVLDYFEGWFDGDVERMDRALHPALVKRSFELKRTTTKDEMVAWTAEGEGKDEDPGERGIEVEVADLHGSIATAVVRSAVYREYVHLVLTSDGWKIANALWQYA
jgi:ribosomal protein S12 methylthiotransferase accessory factor YcaO